MSSESLRFVGSLQGHRNWVTCIATSSENPDILLTGSRDKTIILWNVKRNPSEELIGYPSKQLTGHNHFVTDLAISSDGQFALSSSWDKTLRLWDLNTGKTSRRFVGHSKEVLSVSFSADNRQIVSGSMDRTIKLWNTLGECKFEIKDECHTGWVQCVRFGPHSTNPLIVSCGADKTVKVWDLTKCKLRTRHEGHQGPVLALAVSPDGSLAASGGRDSSIMLWDLNEGKHLYSLTAGDTVNALAFSPNRYWLCAATDRFIKIFDLESKSIIDQLTAEDTDGNSHSTPQCQSLAWSADGMTLYGGFTDNQIRLWDVTSKD